MAHATRMPRPRCSRYLYALRTSRWRVPLRAGAERSRRSPQGVLLEEKALTAELSDSGVVNAALQLAVGTASDALAASAEDLALVRRHPPALQLARPPRSNQFQH